MIESRLHTAVSVDLATCEPKSCAREDNCGEVFLQAE